ncbi:GDSL-type esterase/lipase family protein [Butyrivibrio sp.]|jgi:lysophospholipase L1-like esterase|uniref:GDSL-type esterase/lipase family protein n=1 Tax=Butyrivibrio sp. TaxID=28121 RepID=UPI0025BC174F|nr:GDSL-type esterase/lipase family protein [Butyrivibrio sp.]
MKKQNDNSSTDAELALKNGGWNDRRFEVEPAKEEIAGRKVTILRYEVSEFGTYKVTFELKPSKRNIENMVLFAGRRNMIEKNISISSESGMAYKKEFYVAVTPYIPALSPKRCNDKVIFVSFTGLGTDDPDVKVNVSITREDVPVIWVAGDSTLTDQNAGDPYFPYGSCSGWAQTISRAANHAAVCNLAHSGMTSNCFRDDGHYDIAKELMKKGDLFLIQFGHNDQKRRNLAAFGGYEENLKRYIEEVRSFGAIPVLCTPISRIPGKDEDGKFYSMLDQYSKACYKVAKETDTILVDLHDYTFKKWIEYGDRARDYFIKGDITHTNEYGAVLIADFFLKSIKDKLDEKYFSKLEEDRLFTPDTDTKDIPKELPSKDVFSIEPPFVDTVGIPEYEGIKKAFRYGLLDPCVMHLHPYAVMPRAQLLMVMFKAFRLAGKRPYLNEYADINELDWDAGYVQALHDGNLIDPETIAKDESGNLLFRPDDPLTYREFASFIIRYLEKDITKRDISLSECEKRFYESGFILYGARSIADHVNESVRNEKYRLAEGEYISRAEVYSTLSLFIERAGDTGKELPSDVEVHPVH